ncbi:MAG: hypothetical protein AB7U95_37740 [Reyranella sp.]
MATLPIVPFDGTATSGYIQNPVRGVQSADIITGGQQLDSDDTVTIDCEFNDDVLLFILDTGGGAVVSIAAGDYPTSPLAELGAEAYTIPDADGVLVVPEAGRHVKSTGKIHLTTTQQVLVWAFRLPAAFVGVGAMNRTSIPAAPTD